METLLIAREGFIRFYKRFEPIIVFVFRFLLGMYVFSLIHGIGHARPEFAVYYDTFPLTLIMGLAFAILPTTLLYLLMIVDITIQYSAIIEVAVVVFIFLLLVLLLYARMAVKESILIILTLVAWRFNMPYIIPLIAGMYFSMTTVLPVAIGVFIHFYLPQIEILTRMTPVTTEFDPGVLPATLTDIYTHLANGLIAANDWIYHAVIFGMVIILVRVVSRLSIDFAKEIAIGLGCAMMIFCYIMASMVGGANVPPLGITIVLTLLSGVLVWIIRLFDPILDYQRAESVQFEDEDNFYYVRVVPKIQLTRSKRVVKRIRPQPEEEDED